MKKMICFDMDGTIADLYSVPNWLEKLEVEDVSPYVDAEPMWDMDRLRNVLLILRMEGWEIRVISWLSRNASEEFKERIREAKRHWLVFHNFPIDAVHLIAYGATKANCVRHIADAAILIDDNEKVRNGWHLGETIDPMDGDLIEKLWGLVEG